jgi:hypothetical protein
MKAVQDANDLNRKLDLIIQLLAYQIVSDKRFSEAAPVLKRLGMSTNEIASVIDTSVNSINALIAIHKKAKKSK